MKNLNSKQISYLRSLAHSLSPVVMIGNNGLSEAVLKEIDSSLKAHELIKIKVKGVERSLRLEILKQICEQSGAVEIQHIGKQLVIYRRAEKPHITLP